MSHFWGLIFEKAGQDHWEFMRRYQIDTGEDDEYYDEDEYDEEEEEMEASEEEPIESELDAEDYEEYEPHEDERFDYYSIAPKILITKDGEKTCEAMLKDVDWDKTFKDGGGFEFKPGYCSVDCIVDRHNFIDDFWELPEGAEVKEGETEWMAYIRWYAQEFLKKSPHAMVYAANFHE